MTVRGTTPLGGSLPRAGECDPRMAYNMKSRERSGHCSHCCVSCRVFCCCVLCVVFLPPLSSSSFLPPPSSFFLPGSYLVSPSLLVPPCSSLLPPSSSSASFLLRSSFLVPVSCIFLPSAFLLSPWELRSNRIVTQLHIPLSSEITFRSGSPSC